MAVDPELAELLTQQVTIEHLTGQDSFTGDPTYGPPTVYPARVTPNPGNKLVRTAQGQEVVYSRLITLGGDVPVTLQDRITLPDGAKPAIIAVGKVPDEDGTIHRTKVWV